VVRSLDDRAYGIVDELASVAKQLDTTPARVALAWAMARPGVASSIIGARTMQQLDDNLGAADVTLSREQIAALDARSRPQLPFPVNMIAMAPVVTHGGTTIDGVSAPAWPNSPASDAERH